jgi:hypothetical protein
MPYEDDELSLDELEEAAGGALPEGTNTNCATSCGNTNCVQGCTGAATAQAA